MGEIETVKAEARLDGKWWFIYFPELRLTGQAKRRDNLPGTATKMAALFLDVPESEVKVTVDIVIPKSVRIQWDQARDLAAAAAKQERQATQSARRAVRDLLAAGFTQRDAAQALGISHQRVHQLSHGGTVDSESAKV